MTARPALYRRLAIAGWLAFLLACALVIGRSAFTTDLSAFLPSQPTPAQQLLIDQIRDGLPSRLILIAVEGADAPTRARVAKDLAGRLREQAAFVSVNNGEPVNAERDRAFLFSNRYLLSPAVTPERFSVAGLHASLAESIDLLASPAGLLVKSLLPRDPTGEMLVLLDQLGAAPAPRTIDGAWASRDGTRALLLAQTRASGADTDAQQQAMAAIEQAFAQASAAVAPAATGSSASNARLLMTGPGVFSVRARDTIKAQVTQLSLLSMALIAALLLAVYRSPAALALGFVPVLSGALAGVTAVSLGFGQVHGITLGFGTALIGEAVDYSIYLFVQSERGADRSDWIKRFWPTIRLGVLTSIAGFAALLFSGFPGLAQLGLYAVAGLIVAAMVTRFVLPQLLPAGFRIHDVAPIGRVLARLLARASRLRLAAATLVVVSAAVLGVHHADLWDTRLSSLSPVSPADVALDTALRADLGAPDLRYLVVVAGPSREAVLGASERVSTVLQRAVEDGRLAAFDSASRYLPSEATQRARQASLPPADELQERLAQALAGLPLKADRLAPFLEDVARARNQPLLQGAALEKTSMAMAIDALLIRQERHWSALLPLTAPAGGDIDAGEIRAALAAAAIPDALLVDMKRESNDLYSAYLDEAIWLSLGGLATIVALLLVVLRSPLRVLRIVGPLAAAVVTVTAGLVLGGQQLIILHLVGLLLVVAVGSNYALFFDRHSAATPGATALSPRTLASMLFAGVTTVAGFGLLAFSSVALLQALGATVAPGVVLALVYAAIFARPPEAGDA